MADLLSATMTGCVVKGVIRGHHHVRDEMTAACSQPAGLPQRREATNAGSRCVMSSGQGGWLLADLEATRSGTCRGVILTRQTGNEKV